MRHVVASLLICMSPRVVWAISAPLFPDDVKTLQRLLDASNQLDEKAYELEQSLEKERDIDPDKGKIAKLEKQIANLKQERDLKRNVAIHEALRVYRIVPVEAREGEVIPHGRARTPSGTIVVPGTYTGKQAHWIPIARDNEPRQAVDANGNGLDGASGKEPKGGGVGNGNGPAKRTGEKIKNSGKWPQ